MNAKHIVRIGLLVVAAGFVAIFLSLALPVPISDARQQAGDEAIVKKICDSARKRFEEADATYQGAVRRGLDDEIVRKRREARDAALREYCRCLIETNP